MTLPARLTAADSSGNEDSAPAAPRAPRTSELQSCLRPANTRYQVTQVISVVAVTARVHLGFNPFAAMAVEIQTADTRPWERVDQLRGLARCRVWPPLRCPLT